MIKKIKSVPQKIEEKVKRSHHKKIVAPDVPFTCSYAEPVTPNPPEPVEPVLVQRRSWRERLMAWWD